MSLSLALWIYRLRNYADGPAGGSQVTTRKHQAVRGPAFAFRFLSLVMESIVPATPARRFEGLPRGYVFPVFEPLFTSVMLSVREL